MLHTRLPSIGPSTFPAWCVLTGLVVGLGIFTATYFAYFSSHEAQRPGSYLPLAIGLGSFFLLTYVVIYLGTSAATLLRRHAKATGVALVAAFAFFLFLMFLILNTLGV